MPEHRSDGLELSTDRPGPKELVGLYDAVGWTAYTDDPAQLERAIHGSSRVVTARDERTLVGLARVISDGETICYLQDVLVRPDRQRTGLGRRLVTEALRPFAHVRQTVLLTDDEAAQRAFYQALGLTEVRDYGDGTLRAFVRLR